MSQITLKRIHKEYASLLSILQEQQTLRNINPSNDPSSISPTNSELSDCAAQDSATASTTATYPSSHQDDLLSQYLVSAKLVNEERIDKWRVRLRGVRGRMSFLSSGEEMIVAGSQCGRSQSRRHKKISSADTLSFFSQLSTEPSNNSTLTIDSPYSAGVFKLQIEFPHDYPFKPPKIAFRTPIFHCNISLKGNICLNLLSDEWNPRLSIRSLLISILQLMKNPNPNDAYEAGMARMLLEEPDTYNRKAVESTAYYAVEQKCRTASGGKQDAPSDRKEQIISSSPKKHKATSSNKRKRSVEKEKPDLEDDDECASSPKRKRIRRSWTQDEIDSLLELVAKHDNWRTVHSLWSKEHGDRTIDALKSKYRTIWQEHQKEGVTASEEHMEKISSTDKGQAWHKASISSSAEDSLLRLLQSMHENRNQFAQMMEKAIDLISQSSAQVDKAKVIAQEIQTDSNSAKGGAASGGMFSAPPVKEDTIPAKPLSSRKSTTTKTKSARKEKSKKRRKGNKTAPKDDSLQQTPKQDEHEDTPRPKKRTSTTKKAVKTTGKRGRAKNAPEALDQEAAGPPQVQETPPATLPKKRAKGRPPKVKTPGTTGKRGKAKKNASGAMDQKVAGTPRVQETPSATTPKKRGKTPPNQRKKKTTSKNSA